MSDVEVRDTGDRIRALEDGPSLITSMWRYRVPIVVATVVAAVLFYWLSSLRPLTFVSTATVLLQDPTRAAAFQGGGSSVDPERYVPQQANLVTSRPVLRLAAEETGLDAELIGRRVEVGANPELLQMTVTASANDPEVAATIANAVVDAYEVEARQQSVAQVETAEQIFAERIAVLREQIAEVEAELQARPDDTVAESRLRTLEGQLLTLETRASEVAAGAAAFGSGVQLREDALPPDDAASPNPLRDAMLAAMFAFALASAVAYWRAGSTRRVEDRADPGQILGVPLLGEIPRFSRVARSPQGLMAGSEASEAYQFVLSSIEFSMAEIGASSLLITSATPGDGKTSTALHLAIANARETRPVLLVDADIRARGLTELLRADDSAGLVELATGDVELRDVVREYRLTDASKLSVVPSGRRPEDSIGLLRTTAFTDAVEHIKNKTDLAIFDSPPLLAVADSTVLASRVDAIVLVVDRSTETEQLQKVRERLTFISTPLIGYVYNRAQTDRSSRYGYGYGTEQAKPLWRRLTGGRRGA